MVRLIILILLLILQFPSAEAKPGVPRAPRKGPNAAVGLGGPASRGGPHSGLDDSERPVKPAAAPPITNGRSLKQQRAGSETQQLAVSSQPSAVVNKPAEVVAPPPVFDKSLMFTPEEIEKIRILFQAYLDRQKSPQPQIVDKSAKVEEALNKLEGQPEKELPPAPTSIYLNSVLYRSVDSAVAWINGKKYELGVAQDGIKLVKVTPNYAELEWQADGFKDVDFTDWSVIFPEAKNGDDQKTQALPPSRKDIKVNSEFKTVDVLLKPNQFLDIQNKAVKEGHPVVAKAPETGVGNRPGMPNQAKQMAGEQSSDDKLKPLEKMVENLVRPENQAPETTPNPESAPNVTPHEPERNNQMETIPSPTEAIRPAPVTSAATNPSTPVMPQNPATPPLPNPGSATPPLPSTTVTAAAPALPAAMTPKQTAVPAIPPLPATATPALPPLQTAAATSQPQSANNVRIPASPNGHYDIDAKINSQTIRFRVDTGATYPVVSKDDARRLGINVDKLQYDFEAKIADGTIIKSAKTVIGEMDIQGLIFKDVTVMVANGNFPQPLLGASFLNTINWSMSGGVMTITK